MRIPLTPELFWLVLTILMTSLFWIPYIVNRIKEQGLIPVLTNPRLDTRPHADWAIRMMKAHSNAVENLVIFAPLALAVHSSGLSNKATALACLIYFIARLIHFVVYTMGLPYIRTLAFAVGFMCQLTLALNLLA